MAVTYRHASYCSMCLLCSVPHSQFPTCCFGQHEFWQCEGSIKGGISVPYLILLHIDLVRTDFSQLSSCYLHNANWPAPYKQRWESQKNGPSCFQMRKTSSWNPQHKPFIVAEVFICKLFEKGPFHNLFGSIVLQEVNEHMLQPGIVLRGGGLFGKEIEPGVFFMECLPMKHRYWNAHASDCLNSTGANTELKCVLQWWDSHGR